MKKLFFFLLTLLSLPPIFSNEIERQKLRDGHEKSQSPQKSYEGDINIIQNPDYNPGNINSGQQLENLYIERDTLESE